MIYHGQEQWNGPLKLSGMIDHYEQLPDTVTQYIPEYRYILYNLSTYTDQELVSNMLLLIVLRAMRAIFIKDEENFYTILHELVLNLEKVEDKEKAKQFFETLIIYILSTRQDLELKRIYEIAKEVSLERGEVMMTLAEKLIMEGMEKGVEKGKLEVAKNLLELGIEMEKIVKATGLPEDEIKKLMN